MRKAHALSILGALAIAGCAGTPIPKADESSPFATWVQPFSSVKPGNAVASAWKPYILSRLKRSTEYSTVEQDGKVVVKAIADRSASGISQPLSLNVSSTPFITWTWNVSGILQEANNAMGPDDAPARVVVAFEGDKSKWDFEDRAFADRIRGWTGHDIPYATLMYIWSNTEPVGSVITNRHTSRIKMIVAESGPENLRKWVPERWNLIEDYRRAFGEEPGKVTSVGVMSDTDNTGERIITYYGDIAFAPKRIDLH
jgi:hypothetical protein